MIEIRKTIILHETVFSELGVEANRPVTRAVGMAVISNPFACVAVGCPASNPACSVTDFAGSALLAISPS